MEDSAIIKEFLKTFEEERENVTLSDDEKEFLTLFPNALSNLWKETAKAVALKTFPEIMKAMIEKALKGDTSAAKFVFEFCQPNDDSSSTKFDVPQWESKALQLRDALNIELSAQDCVVNLLDSMLELGDGAKDYVVKRPS